MTCSAGAMYNDIDRQTRRHTDKRRDGWTDGRKGRDIWRQTEILTERWMDGRAEIIYIYIYIE